MTYPNRIQQERYTHQGRPVLLSAVELSPGQFETALLSADCETEYVILHSESEATVLSDFAHLRRTHRPDNEIPALSGKYAALRDSLRAARAAGLAAAARVPDGGTCNLDSPTISLPRWRSALVEEAARQAGCGCYRWSTSGSVYVFPLHTPGQANKRETAAETATAYLQSQGYDALAYSQID